MSDLQSRDPENAHLTRVLFEFLLENTPEQVYFKDLLDRALPLNA
ncbi:MAG TPA: hypothetical protein VGA56_14005 [Opitutaceae bacterium]